MGNDGDYGKQLAIGVDIGGTRTKIGLVDLAKGKVLEILVHPTETLHTDKFIQAIQNSVHVLEKNIKNEELIGIGFGVPGFVFENGSVDSTYGFLQFMENYPLAAIIKKKLGITCLVDNDARVVALGESLYGKGKNISRVLVLTLGTGLGIGFTVDGVLDGTRPYSHMAGHLTITKSDMPCYCGRKGCLEALLSSAGFIEAAKQAGWFEKYPEISPTPENIFLERKKGNPEAIAIVKDFILFLQTGIDNYINIYAPDMIVLGGGISKSLKHDLHRFQDTKLLRPFKKYTNKIVVSELAEQAGVLGSAALFVKGNR
ncbi:MAG: ROK family protein [Chitinophagaceae bacterium]|nr:ROK family protein [Chitinophagaceae bacterium]